MNDKPVSSVAGDIRRQLFVGITVAVLLIAGVGGWAVITEIAGAVSASGHLVVDSNVKKVQHPVGGVVSDLLVREGDHVRSGDILLKLDQTVTRSNLAVIDKAMVELMARQARGEAERDGIDTITFQHPILTGATDPDLTSVMRGEERLFMMRRTAREGQKAQLRERVGQFLEETRGIGEQVKAKDLEVALIARELSGVRELWQKNLIPIMRLIALERDGARIAGERGALISSIAQVKGKVSEIELQILQIDQNLSAEVSKELSEIRAKNSELTERRVAAEDLLKRIDIRSPQDGVVHQLLAHTVGGVIPAGETIMLIVPEDDVLIVEANISSQEIDRVWIGQKAVLRFTAFNQRTTPELNGEVRRISADISQDPKTGAPFYIVRIALSDTELERLNGLKLVPGMPVDGFIQTGDRTVASYLTKPLMDNVAMAWREK